MVPKYTFLLVLFFISSLVGDVVSTLFPEIDRINLLFKGVFIVMFTGISFLKSGSWNYMLFILMPFLLFFFGAGINIMFFENPYHLIDYLESLAWVFKNFAVYIFFIFYTIFLKKGEDLKIVNTVAITVAGFYLGFIIFGAVFSVESFRTYSSGFRAGYKGVILAQNEGSVMLIFTFFLFYIVDFQKVIKWFFLVLNFFALIIIGTKTGILALVLIVLFVLHERLGFRRGLFMSFVVISLGVGLFYILYIYSDVFHQQVNLTRQYFSYRFQTGHDIVTVLLSGRNDKLFRVFADLSNYSIVSVFIGGHPISAYYVEMDPVDILFAFGFFGFIIYYIFIFRMFISSMAKNELLIFILVSVFAGHATYSVLAAPFIALFLINKKNTNTRLYEKKNNFDK